MLYVSRDTLGLYIFYLPSHSLGVVRNVHLFTEPVCTINVFFTETRRRNFKHSCIYLFGLMDFFLSVNL